VRIVETPRRDQGGLALPEDVARFCESIFTAGGAMFCGPVGGRFVYELRTRFDLYCKLVPLRPSPGLSDAMIVGRERLADVDVLIVRENVGGLYGGAFGRRDGGRVAFQDCAYSVAEVARIVEVAAGLAGRRRGCLAVVVKRGGIPEVSALWAEQAERVARTRGVAHEVLDVVDWYKEYAAKFGTTLGENPSPGNKAGGLLNITIKSLGAMAKAGTTRVEGCTGYAEPPRGRGLFLMQGPGYDQESTPGLVGAGATAVIFTTGRGTTIGNAIAPVIKLASNSDVFARMSGDLDLSAGGVIDGTETIDACGARVFEHLRAVASGEPAKAELLGHREFQVWAEQSVSL
jgi:hypothetical protein